MFVVGSNEPYRKGKRNAVDLFPFPFSFPFLPLTLLLQKTKISAAVRSVVGVIGLQKGAIGKKADPVTMGFFHP